MVEENNNTNDITNKELGIERSKFKFPEEEKLTLFLKDILEDEVDVKYYLSEEQMKKILYPEEYNISSFRQRNLIKGSVCQTLQAAMSHGNTIPLVQIDISQIKREGVPRIYKNISRCLNTAQGGGHTPLIVRNATKKGYQEANLGDGISLEHPDSKTRRGRVQDQIAPTLQCNDSKGVVVDGLTIRKITPKECFRLMGFLNDEIKLDGLSNTQRYKLAGNGWDINLVSKIFKEMNLPDNLKLFEMFSGYGGASFALKKLNKPFECIGYSEIDKYAIECYGNNHSVSKPLVFIPVVNRGSCVDINPEELPDFGLLTAGFPCQSFSIAGKGLGELDARGTLFWDIIRIAEVKKPKYMLLENVKGLTNKKHKNTFDKILSELDRIGYDVFWKVCNTKLHGIPQNRDRIFFVCFRKGLSQQNNAREQLSCASPTKDHDATSAGNYSQNLKTMGDKDGT